MLTGEVGSCMEPRPGHRQTAQVSHGLETWTLGVTHGTQVTRVQCTSDPMGDKKPGVSGPDNDRTIFPTSLCGPKISGPHNDWSLSRGVFFHCTDIPKLVSGKCYFSLTTFISTDKFW